MPVTYCWKDSLPALSFYIGLIISRKRGRYTHRLIHRQADTETGGYRDRWIQRERPADIETGGNKDRLIQRQVDIESDGYAEADGYRDRWIQRQVDIETGGYTEADGYRDRWIQRQMKIETGGYRDRLIQRQADAEED